MKAMIVAAAALAFATNGQAARRSAPAVLPPPAESLPSYPKLDPVVAHVLVGPDGQLVASLVLLNPFPAFTLEAPETLSATLHASGRDWPVTLRRTGSAPSIAPGRYGEASYGFDRPAGVAGAAVLALETAHDGYAFALDGAGAIQVAETPPPPNAAPEAFASAAPPADRGAVPPPVRSNNAFLGNLSSYNPIYGLLGSGTDTNAKLQISFKYQLFGHEGDPDGSWLDGFHFAYTQRMFWDTAANSAPFRDVNYQPEFLYLYTLPKNEASDQLSMRGGFLHESNGRDGDASRAYNILYVQPQLDFPIGGLIVSVGPRVFGYVLGRGGNEDIARYRGHQALAFSIGQQDGFKLSAFSRLNFGTGKGSVDADLSYPLTRIWHELPLYLVVQGFTGYGEDLLDYDRKQRRVRVGIGIVR